MAQTRKKAAPGTPPDSARDQTIDGKLASGPKKQASPALLLAAGAALLGLAAFGLTVWQLMNPPVPDWQRANEAQLVRLSAALDHLNEAGAAQAEQTAVITSRLEGLEARLTDLDGQLAAETDQREALAGQLEQARALVQKQDAQKQQGQMATRQVSRLLLDELWLASQIGADLNALAQLIGGQTDRLAEEMAELLDGTLDSHAALLTEGNQLLEEVAGLAADPASNAANPVTDALASIWNRLSDTVRVRELASDEGPVAAGRAEFTLFAKAGDLAAAAQLVATSEALDSPAVHAWLVRAQSRLAVDARIAEFHADRAAADSAP